MDHKHKLCQFLLAVVAAAHGFGTAQPLRAASAEAVPGETARALRLDEAVRTALERNPALRAARAQIEAATGRSVQARLWPNPEVELLVDEFPPNRGGFSSSQNFVGLAQTVPFPGKKSLDGQIGQRAVDASEWEYRAREVELVRDVKTAFYRALAAEKKLGVARELTGLAEATAAAARKRAEAGAAPDQEQLRAEIELERARVEVSAARRDLTTALNQLAALMGDPREPLPPLMGELTDRADLAALDQGRENMLARHPNLRAVLAHRQRAELELRRARLDPWPDVTVGVAGGRDEAANEALMAFRVSVPLPIFDRAQGRKREARAQADLARYTLTATEQQLVKELEITEARLRAAAEQVEAYRARILPKSEAALQLVRSGFEAGKFELIDLLDAQRTAVAAQLDFYDKLLDLNTARADLEALVLKDAPFPETPAKATHQPKSNP